MKCLIILTLQISPSEAVSYWSDYLVLGVPNRLIGYMAKMIANQADRLSFQQRQFLKNNVNSALRHYK